MPRISFRARQRVCAADDHCLRKTCFSCRSYVAVVSISDIGTLAGLDAHTVDRVEQDGWIRFSLPHIAGQNDCLKEATDFQPPQRSRGLGATDCIADDTQTITSSKELQ